MTSLRHFATIFEENADLLPDNPATICGDTTLTWKEYDIEAAKLAQFMSDQGLKEDSKVGLYMHNSNEYLVAHYAAFKMMGVPINVNYRYQANELIYLLDNSDSEAVFYQGCYANQIKKIRDELPKVKAWIQYDDGTPLLEGSHAYQDVINNTAPMPRIERNEDNIYMLYTGGTTGMPKGVMYTHGGFVNSMLKTLKGMGVDVPEELADIKHTILNLHETGQLSKSFVACPLMHGTGMWLGGFLSHLLGGCVVTTPNLGLDTKLLWEEVERVGVTNIIIVGDSFAKPMVKELDRAVAENKPYDLSALKLIYSSGVMFSADVKASLLKHHDMVIMDAMGSSEGGMGSSVTTREDAAGTAKFRLNPGVVVVSDDGEEVKPGSGIRGLIGTSGLVPEGYYKDKEKSDATFKEFKGTRYSFPGDYALVEEDGTITLLGRGSNCINSAGEKIYPEEVEEALKLNENVYDSLVVGLPDERFGNKVVAVVSLNETGDIDEANLISATREHLSGYKLPKSIIFVAEVMRAPNGKADYKWAKKTAEKELT
tara:strand:- start:1926 stop:3548 length:1623 start_codon:yes stop_codon:yes gene_type:complete